MTVLLVGADKLGNIPQELEQYGCQEVVHWDCRKKASVKKDIPAKIDMILVFHDYISHCMASVIKEKAKRLKLPVFFSKRSATDIKQKMDKAISMIS